MSNSDQTVDFSSALLTVKAWPAFDASFSSVNELCALLGVAPIDRESFAANILQNLTLLANEIADALSDGAQTMH